MKRPLRALIVEDSEADAALMAGHLDACGFDVTWKRRELLSAVREALLTEPWDVVLCDHNLPTLQSYDVLGLLKETGLDVPIVVVSGVVTEEETVSVMRAGARDVILKSALTRLAPAVNRELRDAQVRRERQQAEEELRLLHLISQEIGEARELNLALRVVLQRVCNATGWALGQAWILNPEEGILECTAAWHGGDPKLEEFHRASRLFRFAAGVGLPGRVWSSRQVVRVADLGDEPDFARGQIAREIGFRAALGLPILSADKLVAVIEFFVQTDGEQNDRMLHQVQSVATQLGPFIQRKQAEEALRKNEELFRKLSECSPLGILLTDEHGHCSYSNPRCRSVLGVTLVQSMGEGWLRWVHTEDRERVQAQWFKAVESAQELSCEFRVHTQQKRIWARLRSSMMQDNEGRRTGYVVTVEDISERKQLEALFLQAQKMETVGQLAGGVAHDFNNLLTAICSFGRLAQDTLAADSPARNDIDMILKAAERASGLTRQLLAFARREAVVPQVLSPNTLLTDLEKMLRRLIREDIDLQVNPAPETWPIKIDPSQLEQVLINLVVNARDAMPSGGTIRIETSNETAERALEGQHLGLNPGPYVVLRVVDSGVGMDEEVLAHIFEPFFTTKEQGKGTGLGLATVYGIIKQNGGDIEVTSSPGAGTSFVIYLPKATEEEPAAKPSVTAGAAAAKGTETVLIAEDEPQVRWLTERVLQSRGYRVLVAANGEEALELSQQNKGSPIHLLLTDLVMPRMNGKVLSDRLRHERPGLKVLFMSGYTEELLDIQTATDVTTGLIHKPFTPDGLTAKVRELLQSA